MSPTSPRYHLFAWVARIFHSRFQVDRTHELNLKFLHKLHARAVHDALTAARDIHLPDFFSSQLATYTFPFRPVGEYASPAVEQKVNTSGGGG